MHPASISVRFGFRYLQDYSNAIHYEGNLLFENDVLYFEYQQVDMYGERSGVEDLRLPLRTIVQITSRKPWYDRPQIDFVTRSMRDLDGVPGAKENRLRIKVRRASKKDYKYWLSKVQLRLAELQMEASERSLEEQSKRPELED